MLTVTVQCIGTSCLLDSVYYGLRDCTQESLVGSEVLSYCAVSVMCIYVGWPLVVATSRHALLKGIAALVGVSLSEPHTSGTALWKCVNVRPCLLACLQPYTVNFKCTFKYFSKIERPHALGEGQCWASYCQSAALATVAETAQV